MTHKEQFNFNCFLCGRTGEYISLELFYLGHIMLWLYFFVISHSSLHRSFAAAAADLQKFSVHQTTDVLHKGTRWAMFFCKGSGEQSLKSWCYAPLSKTQSVSPVHACKQTHFVVVQAINLDFNSDRDHVLWSIPCAHINQRLHGHAVFRAVDSVLHVPEAAVVVRRQSVQVLHLDRGLAVLNPACGRLLKITTVSLAQLQVSNGNAISYAAW